MAVQLTPRWGLSYYQGTDSPSGFNQQRQLAEDVENKALAQSGTLAARPTAAAAGAARRYFATDTKQSFISDGTNWFELATNPLLLELPINYAIAGEIRVPVGQVDLIPSCLIPVLSGQVVTLKRVRYLIESGTSVTFKLQRNGSDITGYTGIVATTTASTTDPADVGLTSNDKLQPIVTAVSGTPINFTIAIVLGHEL